MHYKLIITERAEQLLDGLVCYLLHQLKNQQAAIHFLDQIEYLYNCLQENPYQFPACEDEYLMYNYSIFILNLNFNHFTANFMANYQKRKIFIEKH